MSRILFVDPSVKDERDEPIEYYSVFINPPANGLVVENASWEEFLAAREELAKKEIKQ